MGCLGWAPYTPRKRFTVSPARRRYQSLGSASPSASRERKVPVVGMSQMLSAALKMAVASSTSSNMAM
jgi:hypothetical protein